MNQLVKATFLAGIGGALVAGSVAPTSAFVGGARPASLKSIPSGAQFTDVQFRGGGRQLGMGRSVARPGLVFGGGQRLGRPGSGWRHNAWRAGPRNGWRAGHRYGWRGYGYGPGWGYGGAALGAGLFAGAALAGAAVASADDGDDAVGYCANRFKSYNPATGTYLGYDGQYHACP